MTRTETEPVAVAARPDLRRSSRVLAAVLLLLGSASRYLALGWLIAADQMLWVGAELSLEPALVARTPRT